MKILILVNWKISRTKSIPTNLQSPDYISEGIPYWFFKHMPENVDVDVVDIGDSWFTNFIEKKILKFYILQTLRVLFNIRSYDVVMSHGAQSGIFLALLRKLFFIKKPIHILFDIGSFNSAKETGIIHAFMKFASKSIDGVIYHTSSQIDYYIKRFPWLVKRSKFVLFGTDPDFFLTKSTLRTENFVLSIGYNKRDWDTLLKAFEKLNSKNLFLKIIGRTDLKTTLPNVELKKYIPINQLVKEIQDCKFVVVPLDYFNYSYGQMTVLQAMSLGKAVIAARVPSLVDYIEDEVTGIFYESKNVNDLTDKMNLIIEDQRFCKQLETNARKKIETKYNEKEMADQIFQFITSILAKKNSNI